MKFGHKMIRLLVLVVGLLPCFLWFVLGRPGAGELVVLGVAGPNIGQEGSAEDITAFLEENGYRAMRVRPVDMFPMGGHCECVVKLERVGK